MIELFEKSRNNTFFHLSLNPIPSNIFNCIIKAMITRATRPSFYLFFATTHVLMKRDIDYKFKEIKKNALRYFFNCPKFF